MKFRRRLTQSEWFLNVAAVFAAGYLRLVWWTNRFSYHPHDLYESAEPHMPLILALWHGQFFMTPFVRKHYRGKVLVSRHGDGELIARVAARFGIDAIRGSGDHGNAFHRKGGVGAFKAMLRTLADTTNMVLTADVPKRAYIAGLGIIMLARESGRPIAPFAIATSRFLRFQNWDLTTIGLPFGRGAMVLGDLIHVPPDADGAAMEALRQRLEVAMNEVTDRAYALVGRAVSSPVKAASNG